MLITQKFRDLSERFSNKSEITNYFCKGNTVDSVHGRLTTVGDARSTVDRRWCRHVDTKARRRAHRSKASGRSRAWELAGEGEK
jgi:hypothetical protein